MALFLAGNSSADERMQLKKPELPQTEKACAAKGGKWILFPMGRFYFCALKTTDAGRECSDDNECEGDCVPTRRKTKRPGTCAPTLPFPDGCEGHIVNGKIISEPCI